MSSSFFNSNTYYIDEKVNFLEFENSYKVYNEHGEQIGSINQKLTTPQKLLRLLVNKEMLPFMLEIRNAKGELEATISRGWTFWLSKIMVSDAQGNAVARIEHKLTFLFPSFKIYNMRDQEIAEISGDWKARNFSIKDPYNALIGQITKKWNGVLKEFFTTADKYNVSIEPYFSKMENKLAILSSAITIDMIMKEGNMSR